MLSFSARPHWAKHFLLGAAQLRPLYPHWDDFQSIRRTLDPANRLRNPYTDRVLHA